MELGTNEAIKEAILAGLGVTVMSRYTFGLDPESSRYACLDVEGFPLENHWYFAYPAGKQLTAVTRSFLDFARASAKGLARESLGNRDGLGSGAALSAPHGRGAATVGGAASPTSGPPSARSRSALGIAAMARTRS